MAMPRFDRSAGSSGGVQPSSNTGRIISVNPGGVHTSPAGIGPQAHPLADRRGNLLQMLDLYRQTLQRQFGAAIAMLESALRKCPATLWVDDADGGPPFWRLAYHTLFYLDLYLSESEGAFRPAEFHEENAQLFDLKESWLPSCATLPQTVYSKQQVLDYLGDCRQRCARVVGALDERSLAASSGFTWLPFSRAELMLYNLRHVQHHAGQLGLLLRRRAGIENAWVGTRSLA